MNLWENINVNCKFLGKLMGGGQNNETFFINFKPEKLPGETGNISHKADLRVFGAPNIL